MRPTLSAREISTQGEGVLLLVQLSINFKLCCWKKSTLTLGLEIQSLIARALDDNNFVLVASLDLSAAFDVVNVNLLLKRSKIVGLPDDIVGLIKIWLKNWSFYVSVNGENSLLFG